MNAKTQQKDIQVRRANWWGAFPIEVGSTIHWVLGGLDLSITRYTTEWEIDHGWARAIGVTDSEELWSRKPMVHTESERISNSEHHARISCQRTSDQLTISPKMANRSLVSRPWDVLQIPPGETTTLFIGAPLWLKIQFSSQENHFLEIPIRRHSDTWFGPSPMTGELCYAGRTHAFTDPERLLNRPYRALVPVEISNQDETPLKLERINLPVPHLNLYRDMNGVFWGQGLTITREQGTNNAKIRVDEGTPAFAGEAELVTTAEASSDSNILVKTLDMLFA